MFSELPKLLGREFAIGYFLPVLAIGAGAYYALGDFGFTAIADHLLARDVWAGVTAAVASAWLLSLVAMALNRPVIRLLEGYGTVNPIRLMRFLQCRCFDRLRKKIDALEEHDGNERERAKLEAQFAMSFPSRRDLVLATAFGNTVRAFEDYPRVIYGFESIEGWDRLVAIVPPPYRELIDAAKTKVDFSVNIWLGALLLAAAYAAMGVAWSRWPSPWYPGLALIIAWLAARSAKASAYEWGVTIKSAIDVFLPELADKMGYRLPTKATQQKDFWTLLSQTFVYRDAPTFAALEKYRAADPKSPKAEAKGAKKRR